MKFFSIFLLAGFVVGFSTASAQKLLWFDEQFEDNRYDWTRNNSKQLTIRLSGGQMSMETTSETLQMVEGPPLKIDKSKPIRIETRFRIDGETKRSMGFLWDVRSFDNFCAMMMSEDNFTAMRFKPGKPNVFYAQPRPALKPTVGAWNLLKIEYDAPKTKITLNDSLVFEGDWDEPPTGKCAYVFNGPCKISVDYLKVFQDWPVIVAPGMEETIKKENLGSNINSSFAELGPVISADGKTLYFVVGDDPSAPGGKHEIYYSKKEENGKWGVRQNIGKPLNNEGNNAVISVTPDNNTLMVLQQYKPDGSHKGIGFSAANRTADGKWEIPTDVTIKNYYQRGRFVNACLSPDRKTMILSVQRDDSKGSEDLYVCFHQPDGSWSEPLSMGDNLNTPGADGIPFLAGDAQTLYFSTDGRPGFGGLDIFMTRRLDDTWINWSEPLNLGPGVNGPDFDAYFTVPVSGEYAYLVSASGDKKNEDLYRIALPAAVRPIPSVLVSGKVLNQKNKQPIQATITYRDMETDKEIGAAISSPVDGSYQIVLPSGKQYRFLAQKDSFYSVNENLDLKKLKEYAEVKRDLKLAPVEIGQIIRLNNLFFDFGKSDLRNESTAELQQVIDMLKKYPNMVIELGGHTDDVGSNSDNLKLSNDRADAVKNYLTQKGIDPARIQAKGYGESKPLVPNKTDENRQTNRRVEFTILKN